MSSIMILLALVGGAMLSMQAAINGRLGSQVGVFRSAFLTFAVGALITALLIFYFAPISRQRCWMCRNGSCWAHFAASPIS